uniref:Uncharacterized protein n=1 Tax=Opuntia streptacantha TaxID=393608 RepID=A0A7C9F1N7_OPUST
MESPKVQHVTKASSDELLRKFAAMDSDSDTEPSSASVKRRKTNRHKKNKTNAGEQLEEGTWDQSPGMSMRMVERRSLLPQYHQSNQRGRRSGELIRHLGISRPHRLGLRGSRDFRTKSVFSTIEKTWSKAVRGASKVFMEKHYNRHRLLINDMV